MHDLLGYCFIFLGLFIIIMMGISISKNQSGNWGRLMMFILIYLILVPIIYKASKCYQSKLLRQAHFILAVLCRSENNRYYLKRGVEVRPGYLGRWIEFNVIKEGERDIVNYVKQR